MISENNLSGARQAIEPSHTNNVIDFDLAANRRRKPIAKLPGKPADVVPLHGGSFYPPQASVAAVITDLAHLVLTSGADHQLARSVTLDPELYALLAERLLEAEMTSNASPMLTSELNDAERQTLTMVGDYGPDQGSNVFTLGGDMYVDTAAASDLPAAPVVDNRTPEERSAHVRQAMQKLATDMQEELDDLRQFQTVLGELKQEVSKLAISAVDMQRAFGRAAGRSSQ
jgi:hypothetical protein